MYEITKIKPDAQMLKIAKTAFPNYRGRKYKVSVSDRPVNVTSYWSEGSRDYFVAINLNTGAILPVPQNGTPFDGGPIAPNGVIPPMGFVIVENTISRGENFGITFHICPETSIPQLNA